MIKGWAGEGERGRGRRKVLPLYKVKITPGPMKRGRVQKTIKELFYRLAKDSKTEQTFVKSLNDNDMVMVLVNGCKVAAAGLTMI